MPADDIASGLQDPPNNLAAEMAVLGAILFDNNAYSRIGDILRPEDFYAPAHQRIYEVMQNLVMQGRVADGVTLRDYFEGEGDLAEIGGANYLATLIDSAAFGVESYDYSRIIRDLAIRRNLIDIGSKMISSANAADLQNDGSTQIEMAERSLFQLAERGTGQGGLNTFARALTESVMMADAAFQRDGNISGIASGLDDLDHKLGGFHPSDLIILAGRPSMGKSSLATNIAYNAAKVCQRETLEDGTKRTTKGGVVGLFSLEMSSEQLATRIIAEHTRIPSDKIRRGEILKKDFDSIRNAVTEMEKLPIYIDDTGGISVSQIAARARRLQRSFGLDMLIIDYLQLITGSGSRRNDGRVQEITEITQSLKALAKELNIPIIALSQLSRQVEQREDKRPQLSDLRESGSIEQDADVVMFIYRESYYLEREEPQRYSEDMAAAEKWAKWQARMGEVYGMAEIIISKQRHGPIGKVDVAFNPSLTQFANLDRHHTNDGRGDF